MARAFAADQGSVRAASNSLGIRVRHRHDDARLDNGTDDRPVLARTARASMRVGSSPLSGGGGTSESAGADWVSGSGSSSSTTRRRSGARRLGERRLGGRALSRFGRCAPAVGPRRAVAVSDFGAGATGEGRSSRPRRSVSSSSSSTRGARFSVLSGSSASTGAVIVSAGKSSTVMRSVSTRTGRTPAAGRGGAGRDEGRGAEASRPVPRRVGRGTGMPGPPPGAMGLAFLETSCANVGGRARTAFTIASRFLRSRQSELSMP